MFNEGNNRKWKVEFEEDDKGSPYGLHVLSAFCGLFIASLGRLNLKVRDFPDLYSFLSTFHVLDAYYGKSILLFMKLFSLVIVVIIFMILDNFFYLS